jgi:hypothetical protein
VSITSPVPDAQGVAFTAVGRACFLCGQDLSDPAVYWMGATGDLYLHPDCVTKLFVVLARDLHEIQNPRFYGRFRSRR